LELADGQGVFTAVRKRTDVSFLADQRWRTLMPARGPDVEFTPLAYLTDAAGQRYEGYAAALIRERGKGRRPGTILYLWGNLLDGELAEPLLRDALRFAVNDAQPTLRPR